MDGTEKQVSVIVPIKNEEKYIDKCMKSILNQEYPLEDMEVIFVDGLSDDKTTEMVRKYIEEYPGIIKLLENPYRTVPYAMNIGIRESSGKYIVRLDAHSEYPNDYIAKCITTIKRFEADNVGGLAITKGRGVIGNAFAQVLSSKFGVGNSAFRTNSGSGYVDTVPFGTFKRETFSNYGLYDERLTRNQDYELNYRIRKHGGRIYLNSEIELTYYCRDTVSGILRQSYDNGKWNVITSKLCPGSMSLRHFIPLLFVLALIFLPLLGLYAPMFRWILVGTLCTYLVLDVIVSIRAATEAKQFPLLVVLFPIFHISYGLGSFAGLARTLQKEERQNINIAK